MKLLKKISRIRRLNYFALAICCVAAVGLGQSANSQKTTDASLDAVRMSNQTGRAKNGKLQADITAAEHMRRAGVYMANRAFASAREHWQAVLDEFPNAASVPSALLG